jgi:hypothetical protein
VRRAVAVAVAFAIVAVVVGVVLAARGGGDDDKAVARVEDRPITEKQLAEAVDHFRREAKREGKAFPDEGEAGFRTARNQILRVLVYRAELKEAASRLGVRVTNTQVLRRLHPANGSGESEEGGPDSFDYGSAEAQLLLEGIFKRVTRGVRGRTPAELSARRNGVMVRYLVRLQREARVRYEPGYAPSS